MNKRDPTRRRRRRLDPAGLRLPAHAAVAVLASLGVAIVCSLLAGAPLATAATPDGAAAFSIEPLCATPAPGYSGCLGLKLSANEPLSQPGTRVTQTAEPSSSTPADATGTTDGVGLPPGESVEHKTPNSGSLSPENILSAYGLAAAPESAQQTIALVDAYNDPTAEADLKVFDEQFRLPECTGAAGNGCFEQVNQSG
jgi:hypothetical protein